MPAAPIADWLAHHARSRGDHLALIDLGTGRRFTYRQAFDRTARLSGVLAGDFGVRPGNRVMVLARNSTDVYELMLAAWRIGAVFMPVNWRLAPAEVAAIVEDAEPAVIVADDEFLAALPAAARVLERNPGSALSAYERAITSAAPRPEHFAADLDTPNTLLYTSGTTGRPKGVIGTWRMTTVMLLQSGLSAGLSAESVTLTAAPQFHTAGLNSFATPLLHLGGTLAVMDRWEAGAALRHLADPDLRVSHTLGVPTQFLAMARHPDFADARFPAVRIAAVGGAPPTLDLLDTWAAKGLALVPGYGMTEVFGVTQMRADVARRKPTAVGWPALYTSIRIAGNDGSSRPPGTVGEIQIRSPGV
ncbi:MAG: AMP-binding protein, partial [Rhodospirillaceae bacterium]|nr:AMP-binding protein [Rhodospirillaceae bacterium]